MSLRNDSSYSYSNVFVVMVNVKKGFQAFFLLSILLLVVCSHRDRHRDVYTMNNDDDVNVVNMSIDEVP